MVQFRDLINDFSHYRGLLNEQENILSAFPVSGTYHVFLRNRGKIGGKFPGEREAWGKLGYAIVISSVRDIEVVGLTGRNGF